MSTPVIQASFNSGEWAPALNARVDLAKYHSGAALLRNFFVDYRGGATTRPGSRYILQAKSNSTVRLIPFQASFTVSYILEFGQNYIRFYNNGAPVLENATTISSQTSASPNVFTDTAHGYSNGDWLFISGSYYIVAGATTNTFTLTDLFGAAINGAAPFTVPASAQRVYTVTTTFLATELFGIKYTQNVNTLVLCHPNHAPAQLVLNNNLAQPNWTFSTITFGPTLSPPATVNLTSTLPGGSYNVAYVVTSVDVNGIESNTSIRGLLNGVLATSAGTTTVSWPAATGAVSYNVYRSVFTVSTAVPTGAIFGFLGNTQALNFADTNQSPDFSQGPPVVQNPFAGSSVQSVSATNNGNGFAAVPAVTFTAAPAGGTTAQAYATLQITQSVLNNGGAGYAVGEVLTGQYGVQVQVTAISIGGVVTTYILLNGGTFFSGSTPLFVAGFTGSAHGSGLIINTAWGIRDIVLTNAGTGYLVTPTVTFTPNGSTPATAVVVLGAASSGNPTVPGFFQQRLFLGGPVLSPSQFNMSQPGAPYNFNVTSPVAPDNAIQQTLTNTVLNTIKSVVSVSAGLIILADKGAWLLNGGSAGSAISATQLVANPQAYSGASDIMPIVTPNDILYVQSKGAVVRDLAFNFYLNNYVGADISILSSHLFYGFQLIQWAWAEEPFKIAWTVRNDGTLLALSYSKEQELVAWTHNDTNGLYKSVASVTEQVSFGSVDAVYSVVQRTINGQTLNYIERFTELYYPQGYKSSWQVDAGIQYVGSSPASSFSGAQHLSGQAVVGVADGVPFTTTISATGTFTLGTPASLVTVGLAFTPQLQTLAIDLGEPTVQGKRKKIGAVTLRAKDTLGISVGRSFSTLVPMADFVLGNVNESANAVVTDLVTSDGRSFVEPYWDVFGQVCVQQSNPYPATILGFIPEIVVGDDP